MKLFLFSVVFVLSLPTNAGVVINAASYDIGKFHRAADQFEPYGNEHAFKGFVLPNDIESREAILIQSEPGVYSLFFHTFEQLIDGLVKLAQQIDQLNLNVHGVPGGLVMPLNETRRRSIECLPWRGLAYGEDILSFLKYYQLPSKDELDSYESLAAQNSVNRFNCLIGPKEIGEKLKATPAFKALLSNQFKLVFLSCLTGKGKIGSKLLMTLGDELLSTTGQVILSSPDLVLGDWSMGEGLGFWKYESEQQYQRDFFRYQNEKKDADIATSGTLKGVRLNDSMTPEIFIEKEIRVLKFL